MEFTYGRKEFFDDINNESTKEQARCAIGHLDRICQETWHKSSDEVLTELKTKSDREKLHFLKFIANEVREKVSQSSTGSYMSHVKSYLSLCFEIKVYYDDYRKMVTSKIKPSENDFELYPLTKEELRIIMDNILSKKRQDMYMVKKDTGGRTRELLQLVAGDFDFSGKFVKVKFRKSIVKGKSKKREPRLTPETAKRLNYVRTLEPETNLFSTNQTDSLKGAYNNERNSWGSMLKRIYKDNKDPKWIKKQGKNWLINPHSIRAFTKTQIVLATNNSEFADIYVGHTSKRANPTYTDGITKLEDFDRLFEKCIARLSIYDHIEVIKESTEEVQDLRKEVKSLSDLFSRMMVVNLIKDVHKEAGMSKEEALDAILETKILERITKRLKTEL